ncbi:MAG: CBS domain-containing protein [Methylotenera sp.]|nr:CBS domain-containing protein [Oligoflexia bacterium]
MRHFSAHHKTTVSTHRSHLTTARVAHGTVIAALVLMSDIAPYIHRKVVVLQEEATIEQAAKAMDEHGFGCVFISDHQGHVSGVLTDRDIVCRLVAHGRTSSEPISSIMTPNPVSVDEDTELSAVVRLMEVHEIRRVPVVHTQPNGMQRCAGIVSLDDLLASRDIDDYHVMRIVRGQINQPGQSLRSERSGEALCPRSFNVI